MVLKSLANIAKLPLYRIVFAQSLVTIFISVVSMAVSKVAVISAVLAGLSGLLPSLFLVLVSSKPYSFNESGLVRALRGEVGKIILTIALLSGIFALVENINVAVFFGTFILMQVCQLAALWDFGYPKK